MDAFIIHGGKRLRGRVRINGSKNASLPLMAGTLLTDEPVTLHDVPDIEDIRNMNRLLDSLGCTVGQGNLSSVQRPVSSVPGTSGSSKVPSSKSEIRNPKSEILPAPASENPQRHTLRIQAANPEPIEAHYDVVRTMRASICVLGPLLAKRGKARVSMPGGCAIGDRSVDLHIRGLKALGAQIHLEGGYIVAEAPGGRLKGARVFLGGPFGSTVTGTDNVMCAAVLAEGTTIIESAACEPEVEELAKMLIAMGAKITGAGGSRITIEGVNKLHGTDYTVMPDRIEAGTYIMAAAITNGDVTLDNCPTDTLIAVLDRLQEIGVNVESLPPSNGKPSDRVRDTVRVASARRLEPVQVVTQPHPGFPTDLQAQIMALLCLADGNSIITEKIFPERFMHVAELLRMNANILRTGTSAMVSGTRHLEGAPVMASDLRASACLVIAGLAAKGVTTVNRVYHLDRGYEKMEVTLQALGADIQRVNVPEA